MSGNRIGGLKAAEKNKAKNPNFYAEIGKSGGEAHSKGGFKYMKEHDPERFKAISSGGGKSRKKETITDSDFVKADSALSKRKKKEYWLGQLRSGVHLLGKHSTKDNRRSKENLYEDSK